MFALDADRTADTTQKPLPAAPGRRYRFNVLDERGLRDVIVDVDADGYEEWSDQYLGEFQWYSFTPSPDEREMLQRVAGHTPVSQPLAGGPE
jgi:hypothetical protein